jgi:quercetin dioxygenase-like cupin family protein
MTHETEHSSSGEPFKVTVANTIPFERPGFEGFPQVTFEDGFGFSAITIWVDGSHPRKRMLEGTRTYYVAGALPKGTFTLGDEVHEVQEGDLFVIPEGSEYSYQGDMTLFEVNIPSAMGSVRDEKLE